MIDEFINWEIHITNVCQNIFRDYFAIARIRDNFYKANLKNLYDPLIYCHSNYNILFWGIILHIKRVITGQKRV